MTGGDLAAFFGLERIINGLLNNGYDLNPRDTYTRTPLSLAAEKGHDAIVKLLLDRSACIESKNYEDNSDYWRLIHNIPYNRTPLSLAAENGHGAVVELLLDKGVDPGFEAKDNVELLLPPTLGELRDGFGHTSLFYAARGGHEAVVRLLLDKGTAIECKDQDGQTPLFHAARNGHHAVVKLLLDKGADLESRTNNSQTPLSVAAQFG